MVPRHLYHHTILPDPVHQHFHQHFHLFLKQVANQYQLAFMVTNQVHIIQEVQAMVQHHHNILRAHLLQQLLLILLVVALLHLKVLLIVQLVLHILLLVLLAISGVQQ